MDQNARIYIAASSALRHVTLLGGSLHEELLIDSLVKSIVRILAQLMHSELSLLGGAH